MQSTSELQKKVQNLTDEIKDIFYATKLNLEALSVELQSFNQSKVTLSTLAHCKQEFENILSLFEERGSLRLQYLITQQIKEEEAKVRRQRLVEYEQKIYDQRRLISDKETFFDGLLKPRRKRPAHMTIQQFHSMRRQQFIGEQRKNLRRLEQQIHQLKLMERALSKDNDNLSKISRMLEKEEMTLEEIESLENALNKNPAMYDSIQSMQSRRDEYSQIKKLYENMIAIGQQNSELQKQYGQQKELYEYLKWQSKRLKGEYIKKQEEKKDTQRKYKKLCSNMTKYRLRRACSI